MDHGDGERARPPPNSGEAWSAQTDGFVLVERAKGILMERHYWDAGQADDELLTRARTRNETVIEVAYRVVLDVGL